MSKALKVIQFSDTHLYSDPAIRMHGVDTYDTFKRTVDLALENEGRPDFIVLTGDVSMDETARSYDRVREIIEPIGIPIYFLPGNHDCYDTMWTKFVRHDQSTNIKPDRSFATDNWFIILLNSVKPMSVEGWLPETELSRLDQELSENSNLNALVCLHHNPIPIAQVPEKDVGLKNAASMFRILDKHKNVRGVVWGHVHGEYVNKRNGVELLASPSTCIQFRVIEHGVAIDKRPPGYRLLILGDDGSIGTRVSWLPELPEGLTFGEIG